MPVLLTAQVQHYEYVFSGGQIDVYDIDNSFVRVKSVPVPVSVGPLGSVASAATGLLYISYGSNGTTGGSMLKYDLIKEMHIAFLELVIAATSDPDTLFQSPPKMMAVPAGGRN